MAGSAILAGTPNAENAPVAFSEGLLPKLPAPAGVADGVVEKVKGVAGAAAGVDGADGVPNGNEVFGCSAVDVVAVADGAVELEPNVKGVLAAGLSLSAEGAPKVKGAVVAGAAGLSADLPKVNSVDPSEGVSAGLAVDELEGGWNENAAGALSAELLAAGAGAVKEKPPAVAALGASVGFPNYTVSFQSHSPTLISRKRAYHGRSRGSSRLASLLFLPDR